MLEIPQMSAVAKIIPKAKRLRVTARLEHETLRFEGDIFEFIRHLMSEGLSGKGTFILNHGRVDYGMEFDLRKMKVDGNTDSMP